MFVINISVSFLILVMSLSMNAFAVYKYRNHKYDRLTSVVLALFLIFFSLRFLLYFLQDYLRIDNIFSNTMVSTLMPLAFCLISITLQLFIFELDRIRVGLMYMSSDQYWPQITKSHRFNFFCTVSNVVQFLTLAFLNISA